MATARVGDDGSDNSQDACLAKISVKEEQEPLLQTPSEGSATTAFGSPEGIGIEAGGSCVGMVRMVRSSDEDEEEEDDDNDNILRGVVGPRKGDKEFRRRRLTFATQQRMSSNVSPPEASAFTIYRALELGEEDAGQTAPFPASILGIYSCHGAEPGWEEGEEDIAKINQDRACVVYPYLGLKTCALLCVYDGHGERGDMVSNFAMNEIPTRLARHSRVHDDPETALKETFEEVDRALAEAAAQDEQVYSGTTAVVALYRDGYIWVANAGDSRAVLGSLERRTGKEKGIISNDGDEEEEGAVALGLVAVPLSHDHNPDRPGELERIESSGGFVSPPPEEGLSARVWLDEEMTRIGLAMARSIGDHAVKDAGVVATPEVTVRRVDEGDAFVVLASDGVWEFMKNKEVVAVVHNRLKKRGGQEAADACAEVISMAAAYWRRFEGAYRDDISCLVLRLPCFRGEGGGAAPLGTPESVPGVGVGEQGKGKDGGLRTSLA